MLGDKIDSSKDHVAMGVAVEDGRITPAFDAVAFLVGKSRGRTRPRERSRTEARARGYTGHFHRVELGMLDRQFTAIIITPKRESWRSAEREKTV